jgi:hypothetical protein
MILHHVRKLSCNLGFFGTMVNEKKVCKWPYPIFARLWLNPPPPFLKRIWPFIWVNLNSLHVRMVCTIFDWNWPAVWFKKVLSSILIKNCFPSCGPSRPMGIIICTSLNLHYVRKLSCKSELFWLSGSREEKFSMTSPHICSFVIISTWKKT